MANPQTVQRARETADRREGIILALTATGMSRWSAEAWLADYDLDVLTEHVPGLIGENAELKTRLTAATQKEVA